MQSQNQNTSNDQTLKTSKSEQLAPIAKLRCFAIVEDKSARLNGLTVLIFSIICNKMGRRHGLMVELMLLPEDKQKGLWSRFWMGDLCQAVTSCSTDCGRTESLLS